jgi:hypothetical protein
VFHGFDSGPGFTPQEVRQISKHASWTQQGALLALLADPTGFHNTRGNQNQSIGSLSLLDQTITWAKPAGLHISKGLIDSTLKSLQQQ